MWLGWTRPKIMGIVRTLERVPLVGLVGDLVEGYIPLVDEYFYCALRRGTGSRAGLTDRLFLAGLLWVKNVTLRECAAAGDGMGEWERLTR